MHKKGLSFWDILAWIVLFLILLWLILKSTGIINTSDLLTYAPYFGAVYLAGYAMSNLVRTMEDVKTIRKNIYFTNQKIQEIDKDIEIIKINCVRHRGKL